jgi:hypothetical protein
VGYGIVFRGTYHYEDAAAAARAVSAAREELEHEIPEDADLLRLVRDDFDRIVIRSEASIRVEIDEYGPPGLYPIYEMVVETLAESGASGVVTSKMEDEEVDYPAGDREG